MKIDSATPILAIGCGILNVLAAKLLILPGLAIPLIFFMTAFDDSKNVRAFAWFYLIAVIITGYLVVHK